MEQVFKYQIKPQINWKMGYPTGAPKKNTNKVAANKVWVDADGILFELHKIEFGQNWNWSDMEIWNHFETK